MPRDLDNRLRRLEVRHAPSTPLRAFIIRAHDLEAASRQAAEAVAAGQHRPGWPLVVLTGNPATLVGECP